MRLRLGAAVLGEGVATVPWTSSPGAHQVLIVKIPGGALPGSVRRKERVILLKCTQSLSITKVNSVGKSWGKGITLMSNPFSLLVPTKNEVMGANACEGHGPGTWPTYQQT